jgi:hypothetical protein
MAGKENRHYKPTESKYKGGAREMYITYDLEQATRGGKGTATYPKVKRVYIAGDVKDWNTGKVKKRSGRTVHGVEIEYEQTRTGYKRRGFTAKRDGTTYNVKPASVGGSSQEFRKVIEIPEDARNVHFYMKPEKLPKKYQSALQDVR